MLRNWFWLGFGLWICYGISLVWICILDVIWNLVSFGFEIWISYEISFDLSFGFWFGFGFEGSFKISKCF